MNGNELKVWRAKFDLTQQELADALGVTRNAVNQWEMGVRPILKITELALEALVIRARTKKKPAR